MVVRTGQAQAPPLAFVLTVRFAELLQMVVVPELELEAKVLVEVAATVVSLRLPDNLGRQLVVRL